MTKLATAKQLKFATALGIAITPGLTVSQCSELLSDAMQRRNSANGYDRRTLQTYFKLVSAIAHSESVKVIYFGGSQPGSVRTLRPTAINENILKAFDIEGTQKNYKIGSISFRFNFLSPRYNFNAEVPPSKTSHILLYGKGLAVLGLAIVTGFLIFGGLTKTQKPDDSAIPMLIKVPEVPTGPSAQTEGKYDKIVEDMARKGLADRKHSSRH